MKKFAFILLLCVLGISWSGRSLAQSMIPYGFWNEAAAGGTWNTNGVAAQVRPVAIGGNGARLTMSISFFGLANPISYYIPYMGYQIWDATGTTMIQNVSAIAAGGVLVSGPYTDPTQPGNTFVNVSMNVPGGLVNGTTYKPKLTLLAPGLTLSNFIGVPSTSTAPFYTDLSTKPPLPSDVTACAVDVNNISILPLNVAGGGVTGTMTYYWYFDGQLYAWGQSTSTYTGGTVTVPLPTNTSPAGWTLLPISPAPDVTKLNNIICDGKLTLHVMVGGLEYTKDVNIHTSPLTPTIVVPDASLICMGATVTLTVNSCAPIPNPEYLFEYTYCNPSTSVCGPWTAIGTWQSSSAISHTPTMPPDVVRDAKYRVTVRSTTASLTCNPVSPEAVVQISSPEGPFFFGGGPISGSLPVKDFYTCPDDGNVTLTAGPAAVMTAAPENGTVQWQRFDAGTSAWVNISGATGITYDASIAGRYRYIVTETHYGLTCSKTSYNVANVIKPTPVITPTPSGALASSPVINMTLPAPSPGNGSYTGYTVQWYKNGVLIPGATSASYTPTTVGKYALAILHPCGATERSNEVWISGSCSNVGTYYGTRTISTSITGGTYTFDGVITISGSVNFSNVRIYARPNTKIVIPAGARLNITSNTMITGLCAGWSGIFVQGRGEVMVTSSTISDAQAALYIQNPQIAAVANSKFNNNHVSIYLENRFTNNLTNDITITGNQFSSMALAQLDVSPGTSNVDGVYSYVHVSRNFAAASTLKIVKVAQNLFTGIAASVAIPGIANHLVSGDDCMGIMITDNDFLSNRSGVHLDGSLKFITLSGNEFSDIPSYSIYANHTSTKIDNRVLIRQNTFYSTADRGIYLKGINGFRIKLNSFNGTAADGILNGIECYNNDYNLSILWNENLIGGNTFNYVDKGTIIAPVFNVFGAGNLETENIPLNWAVPANIQVLCNNFNNNNYALSGTAPMLDQEKATLDPMNTFIDNNEWDILWFHATANSASPSFTYYYNPANYAQGINVFPSLTPTTFNGYTFPGASVTSFQLGSSTGHFNCANISNTTNEDMNIYPVFKTTSLMENGLENNLSIYPNPVQNQFTIALDAALHADEVQVFNLMGQLVSRVPVGAGQTSVDVSSAEWTDGFYFVMLFSYNEIIGTGKILKVK